MNRCKGPNCRAPIRWVVTEAGRKMALDYAPISREEALEEPRGVFFIAPEDGRAYAWTPMISTALDEPLYRTHWPCPDADRFR